MMLGLAVISCLALSQQPNIVELDDRGLWNSVSIVFGRVTAVTNDTSPRGVLVPLHARYTPLYLNITLEPAGTLAGTFDAGTSGPLRTCVRYIVRKCEEEWPIRKDDLAITIVPNAAARRSWPLFDESVAFFPQQFARTRPAMFRTKKLERRGIDEFIDDLREQRRLASDMIPPVPYARSEDSNSFWNSHAVILARLTGETKVPTARDASIKLRPMITYIGSFDPTLVDEIAVRVPTGVNWPALQKERRSASLGQPRECDSAISERSELRIVFIAKSGNQIVIPDVDISLVQGGHSPIATFAELSDHAAYELSVRLSERKLAKTVPEARK